MTAIAYRDGMMAADSVMVCEDQLLIPCAPKIYRCGDNLVGCRGEWPAIAAFLEWLENGEPADRRPAIAHDVSFEALRARADGTLEVAFYDLHWSRLQMPFHAIGSPALFLMGALYAGASAEEAVRLAIKHTAWCGGEVQVERLARLDASCA